jgi:dihydropyrimidinase
MARYELVLRNGTLATAGEVVKADVGVREGRIVALGENLGPGEVEIDAAGKVVTPGGVDSHCHLDQPMSDGSVMADDFRSGTVSAAFGGTTTVIPFACQMKGQSLRAVVEDYHRRANGKAVIDYAFHLILSDPTDQVLGQELPALIKDGYTSFKVYMTYELLRLDDYSLLNVLALARREGAMVMVHAENYEMIRWLTDRLLEAGNYQAKFHAISHAALAEGEATGRVISLSELMDVPILVVHVSTERAAVAIREARDRGLRVYGETCPQYFFLTADDLNREGAEGTKFCCSPPPRDEADHEAMWRGVVNDTFQVVSSDHAPYRFDSSGKLAHGTDPDFKHVANGIPGIEVRLPLLFSEGVGTGRIDLQRFVELSSTNAARLYGLEDRKGSIKVGADADLAIWDPDLEVTISIDMLHDNMDYTPYEGRRVKGWPVFVTSRGRVVVEDGALKVERGSGEFLPCALPRLAEPLGQSVREMDPGRNFGARLMPDREAS